MLENPSAANGMAVYVAECADQIIGFASCGSQRTESLSISGYDGEITSIYLLCAHQRQGIGKALFCAMTKELLQRGYRGVALWVLRDNVQARGFYDWCQGRIVADREDVRGETVLIEVAYAWPDLVSLNQRVSE